MSLGRSTSGISGKEFLEVLGLAQNHLVSTAVANEVRVPLSNGMAFVRDFAAVAEL